VAAHVPGKAGAALAGAARTGFVSGMDLGLVVASVVVAVAGLVVLAALPSRAQPSRADPSPSALPTATDAEDAPTSI